MEELTDAELLAALDEAMDAEQPLDTFTLNEE